MTREPARRPLSKLGIHARVWLRAVLFGLAAYACIHGLIWAVNVLKDLRGPA